MTGAIPGVSAKLYRGNGDSPETFTQVPGAIEIQAPRSVESAAIETSDLNIVTDSSGFRTYIGSGVKNHQPFIVKIQYLPGNAVQDSVRGDVGLAGTPKNYRVEFPTNPAQTWTGGAVVTRFSTQPLELETLLSAEIEFQPSGTWTLA